MKETAIVYMVAGISSRFGGKIKQLIKISPNGETLIEYSLNQALKSKFSKIIFIVGNKTEAPFRNLFGSGYKGIPVLYACQTYDEKERDKPWGTTDSICSAINLLNCPFVVCNGDDVYGENTFKVLFEHLQSSGEDATIGFRLEEAIPESGDVKRAIFKVDGEYVKKLSEVADINKRDYGKSGTKPEDLCSMNIFALHPKSLEMLNEAVIKFKQEHKGDRKIESLLPNDISCLIEGNKITMKIYPATDKWLGVTNPEDEEAVRSLLNKK